MVTIIHERDKKRALLSAVETLSIEKGSTVAIKPNLCIQRKEACTDFELLNHLVEYVREFSPQKILIVESDTYKRSIWEMYEYFNFHSLHADLVNVSEEPSLTLWPQNTSFLRAFSYPAILEEVDCMISFAKLKTHLLTIYTGVLKNQYGLLPYPDKRVFHRHLDKVIVDMNLIFPCDFYILDSISAMQGKGPLDGDLLELNLLFSGTDPVALDHCACTSVGIKPEAVSHVVLARESGLGSFEYEIEGEIPDVKGFMLPGHS